MPKHAVLVFKDPATGNWHDNLNNGGVRVRYREAGGTYRWITLTVANTRIMNPDHDPSKHAPDDPNFPRWTIPI